MHDLVVSSADSGAFLFVFLTLSGVELQAGLTTFDDGEKSCDGDEKTNDHDGVMRMNVGGDREIRYSPDRVRGFPREPCIA